MLNGRDVYESATARLALRAQADVSTWADDTACSATAPATPRSTGVPDDAVSSRDHGCPWAPLPRDALSS